MTRARPDAPVRAARRRAAGWLLGLSLCASPTLAVSCSHSAPGGGSLGEETQRLAAGELVVDTSLRRQHITGFGASSAWIAQSLSEETADLLFTDDPGIGLSLLRMRIAPDGNSSERAAARSAQARGAKIWAAPWSPPGAWKTSGTDTSGGSLLPEYYEAWAERLAAFAASMAADGVPLLALSAQNEPNWVAEWETCVYTPEELKTFIRDHLGPALRRESPGTLLVAPESIDWLTLAGYAGPLLEDPQVNAEVGIVAVHAYGGTPFPYDAPAEHGKEFWETEVSYDDVDDAAIVTAREVHKHLAIGQVNAFHYWWLVSDTSAGLVKAGLLTPQGYGLAHFSKFVRPGFVRVAVPPEPLAGLFTSAYVDPDSGRTVIVAVNDRVAELEWSFRVEGVAPATVEPWVTAGTAMLAPQEPFEFQNPFRYTLPSKSVTTFVVHDEGGQPAGSGGEGGGGAGAAGESGGEGGERQVAGTAGAGEGGAAGSPEPAPRAGAHNQGGDAGDAPEPRGGAGSKGQARAGSSSHGGASSGSSAAGRRVPAPYSACSYAAERRGGKSPVAPLSLLLLSFALRRRASRVT